MIPVPVAKQPNTPKCVLDYVVVLPQISVSCLHSAMASNECEAFYSLMQEYDRPNSAYMLFYERSEILEPVHQAALVPAAPAQAEAETTSVDEQQQTGSCHQQPSSPSQTSPESLPSQRAASVPATRLREEPTGSPMQAEASAACGPEAMFSRAQESLQEHSPASPAAAATDHLPMGLSSPMPLQPQPAPTGTPDVVANLSPLKV